MFENTLYDEATTLAARLYRDAANIARAAQVLSLLDTHHTQAASAAYDHLSQSIREYERRHPPAPQIPEASRAQFKQDPIERRRVARERAIRLGLEAYPGGTDYHPYSLGVGAHRVSEEVWNNAPYIRYQVSGKRHYLWIRDCTPFYSAFAEFTGAWMLPTTSDSRVQGALFLVDLPILESKYRAFAAGSIARGAAPGPGDSYGNIKFGNERSGNIPVLNASRLADLHKYLGKPITNPARQQPELAGVYTCPALPEVTAASKRAEWTAAAIARLPELMNGQMLWVITGNDLVALVDSLSPGQGRSLLSTLHPVFRDHLCEQRPFLRRPPAVRIGVLPTGYRLTDRNTVLLEMIDLPAASPDLYAYLGLVAAASHPLAAREHWSCLTSHRIAREWYIRRQVCTALPHSRASDLLFKELARANLLLARQTYLPEVVLCP